MASSLRGDIDHLKDTMLAADAGIGIDFDELTALFNHLLTLKNCLFAAKRLAETLVKRCVKH
jgi:hypothetical protein